MREPAKRALSIVAQAGGRGSLAALSQPRRTKALRSRCLGQVLVPAREGRIRRLGKRRSEMNGIESAKCPTFGQFTRPMHNVLGYGQPVDRGPHLVQGCNGLSCVRRPKAPAPGSGRHGRTALGIGNDGRRAAVSRMEKLNGRVGVRFAEEKQLDESGAIEIGVRSGAP